MVLQGNLIRCTKVHLRTHQFTTLNLHMADSPIEAIIPVTGEIMQIKVHNADFPALVPILIMAQHRTVVEEAISTTSNGLQPDLVVGVDSKVPGPRLHLLVHRPSMILNHLEHLSSTITSTRETEMYEKMIALGRYRKVGMAQVTFAICTLQSMSQKTPHLRKRVEGSVLLSRRRPRRLLLRNLCQTWHSECKSASHHLVHQILQLLAIG